ncbi:arginine--tRNA ligase [Yunchengibacter salinarum]|uniref:arginine--tRNA ligase n=1 Tax=Yunchengibacter salinarum TaxID=3133399 RepID=UPI0035B6A2A1
MNIFDHFTARIADVLAALGREGALPQELDLGSVTVEPPRDPAHGDIATNAAMVLAKQARMKPRAIADMMAPRLEALDGVASVEVAGPGFINLRLTAAFLQARIPEVLRAGTAFGDSDMGGNSAVNVEYVSANPTGPLHVGHVRGAVFGDALANLLAKTGHSVTKEYYINDAGSQIDTLTRSFHLRVLEALGQRDPDAGIPEGLYPGEYLKTAAQAAVADGTVTAAMVAADEAAVLTALRPVVLAQMMDLIRADLAALGVRHDVFTSEKDLHDSGIIPDVLEHLEARGHIYQGVLEPPKGKKPEDWEPREQTLFRTTHFGDDSDRPLRKSTGDFTYFAADIAYHHDKIRRGFKTMIDVLGADHGGYVKRMKAAVKALDDDANLDVKLCQLVHLYDGGEPVKMSKRAGTFVTLKDVVDTVGADVTRFIMLTRKNDAPLDFDFAKVKDQSKDNPVFYVQYAHARVHSVLARVRETHPDLDVDDEALAGADMSLLADPAEVAMIRRVLEWPRQVAAAAEAHEPHRLAFFLYELASELHSFWNKGNDAPELRFVQADNAALTAARLAMIRSVALVIASGLEVMGVTPVEELR